MEEVIKAMNNYGIVIFSDMQMGEPWYLCLRENGELYICTVEIDGDNFIETNLCELSEQEALLFVANSTRKAIDTIHAKKIQSDKTCCQEDS